MTSETGARPDRDPSPGSGGTGDDEPDVNTGVVRPDADLENLDGPSRDEADDDVPDGHA
ncbi:hypothetical protein [Sanguibacter suarezii]|uniref:hypothetical protein n=1 Tax=Sanguibacter suarezii TaxID=60921 RepID=UPI000AA40D62|nr:hypothetical protein [Sanguibacter suarezii]